MDYKFIISCRKSSTSDTQGESNDDSLQFIEIDVDVDLECNFVRDEVGDGELAEDCEIVEA